MWCPGLACAHLDYHRILVISRLHKYRITLFPKVWTDGKKSSSVINWNLNLRSHGFQLTLTTRSHLWILLDHLNLKMWIVISLIECLNSKEYIYSSCIMDVSLHLISILVIINMVSICASSTENNSRNCMIRVNFSYIIGHHHHHHYEYI